MKARIAQAAADRLAIGVEDVPMTEDEVLRVLARIARTGKPADRLRAAELIGKQLGMFRESAERGMTLEELITDALRDGRRLPAGAVTFNMMDPYAEAPQEESEMAQ
jgi:hypothetical protein